MMHTAGIYLHIPFCIKKCAYCDFYSITDLTKRPPFVAALLKEIYLRREPKVICDSVYLGGGTPSLLNPKAIDKLFSTLRGSFSIADQSEITIEANPATLCLAKLVTLRQIGVNRINIGIQSFTEKHLSFLGRCHTAEEAHKSLADARKAGFTNVGLDLIYGLPEQTENTWQQDLEIALSYTPEHISCYMLSYEPDTFLDNQRRYGKITPLSETKVAHLFEFTSGYLTSHGYNHYEISNFARKDPHKDLRSRHNRKYWNFSPYYGFGPAAHSYSTGKRTWNVRNVVDYIKTLSQKQLPMAESETLSLTQQRLEAIYLGLRQSSGIDLTVFKKKFGEDLVSANQSLLKKLRKEKMVICNGETLALTVKGMRFMDSIVPLLT